MPEVEDAVERVAAILKRQRRERYEQEAVAGSGDLVDHEDAREIVAALQSSQPREEAVERVHLGPEMEAVMRDAAFEASEHQYDVEAQPRSPVEDAWQPAIEQLGLTLQGADGCETMLDAVKAIVAQSPADPRVEELVEALAKCQARLVAHPDRMTSDIQAIDAADTALAAFGGQS